ncbi:MAG TPA: hypothetical protein VFT72_05870 [Opitutaceae bacterium]|nr:hypothetical protein [Opitutaceae bacterium]
MNTRVFLFLFLVLLAGCAGQPAAQRAASIVRPGLIMVPADQLKYYSSGNEACASPHRQVDPLAPNDARSVHIEPEVVAQQWNRYADPVRPDELMHEAHIVYRREGRTRWRLRTPTAAQQILIGPQLTDGRGEVRELASQELESYIRDGRTNLRREQEVMARMAENFQRLSEQQGRLAEEIGRLQADREKNELPADSSTTDVQSPEAASPNGVSLNAASKNGTALLERAQPRDLAQPPKKPGQNQRSENTNTK